MGHQVEAHRGRLLCLRCGQQWQDRHHYMGDLQCPGPAIGDYHKEIDHGSCHRLKISNGEYIASRTQAHMGTSCSGTK
eukprot:10176493-Karenia_brevis.AAC.1